MIKLQPKNFVSAIGNIVSWFAVSDTTHFVDQVRMGLVSQLINGISRVLQKVLKYFNGTITVTFFVSLASVSAVIFCYI